MKLTNEQIEEQILLWLDGELNETDAQALMGWLAQHPEHQAMAEAFRATYLEAEETIVFADKESLLRPEESTVVPFRKTKLQWMRAAAAIVILLCSAGAFFYLSRRQENIAPELAAVQHTTAPALPATGSPATADTAHTTLLAKVDEQPPVMERAPKRAVAGTQKAAAVPETRSQTAPLEPLPLREEALVAAAPQQQPAGLPIHREPVAMLAESTPTSEPLPGWIPVKEESLEGVNELVSKVQAIRNHVAEKAKSLKHATFVLRFGEKEIAIGK